MNKNPVAAEPGGLSGKPLFGMSTNLLKDMYILTRVCRLFCNDLVYSFIFLRTNASLEQNLKVFEHEQGG